MTLPNFSYLIADSLAGSAHPGWGQDLGASLTELSEQGIKAILTVCEESLDPVMIKEFDMKDLHLPVMDFTAPSIDQIVRAVEFIDTQTGDSSRVLVHCAGGYGRTGTILACYLVSRGRGAAEAIHEVRLQRPGSIEVPSQEQAIELYERHLREHSAPRDRGGEERATP